VNLDELAMYLKQHSGRLKVMEVCGTHTSSIFKNGVRSLISDDIVLVSGPGCPACVTPPSVIDALIRLSQQKNTELLSFGDMFRVPGSRYSLAQAKAQGSRVRLIYSPLEVLRLAKEQPSTQFIVAAVGFETTIPVYASLLEALVRENIRNVTLYTALKTIPEALEYICTHEQIDAFLCPGHVSVIIGSAPYRMLAEKYLRPFVIAGFDVEHILSGLHEIVIQKKSGRHEVKNLYPSVVQENGQSKAMQLIDKYFEKANSFWRGIGEIENSGYSLKKEYECFSANIIGFPESSVEDLPEGCRCADVLLGRILPNECALFGRICTPRNPVGSCMASSEGTCRIYSDGE